MIYYNKSIKETLKYLKVDENNGLNNEEIEVRRKKYGYNEFTIKEDKFIVEKIFDEDLIIGNGQIVIDKNTNISLTKEDIERNKEEYINELITEFDNFINMYIDNKTLVIVYNKSELRNMFFDNDFDSELIVRYLK